MENERALQWLLQGRGADGLSWPSAGMLVGLAQ